MMEFALRMMDQDLSKKTSTESVCRKLTLQAKNTFYVIAQYLNPTEGSGSAINVEEQERLQDVLLIMKTQP